MGSQSLFDKDGRLRGEWNNKYLRIFVYDDDPVNNGMQILLRDTTVSTNIGEVETIGYNPQFLPTGRVGYLQIDDPHETFYWGHYRMKIYSSGLYCDSLINPGVRHEFCLNLDKIHLICNYEFYADVANGSMYFSGTKSRLVSTDQYSDRLLYCYETPSPLFGDVGEGTIGEDGKCYIWLDPVFAQTITTTQYQVFLQRYGSGECWVSERKGSYFVVEGTPGMAFGWEIKAKQRDFDQRRLERNDEPFTVPTQTYGEDAAKHIDELRKERISA